MEEERLAKLLNKWLEEITEQDGYICPPEDSIGYLNRAVLPEHETSVDADKVTVKFPNHVPGSAGTGHTVQDYTIRIEEVDKIKHEFTLGIFTLESDQRLESVFRKQGDGLDHLTPDIIRRYEDTIFVLEFTTSQSSNNDSLKRAFKAKREAYETALLARVQDVEKIVFGIVVISPGIVVTNIPFDQETIDELIFRYLIASDVHQSLLEKGIIKSDQMLERTERSRKVANILGNMNHKYTHPGITEEHYKAWMSDFDANFLNEMLQRSVTKAGKTLKEQHFLNEEQDVRKGLNWAECKDQINKYKESMKGRQEHVKSIVPIPFIVLPPGDGKSDLDNFPKPAGFGTDSALWWEIYHAIQSGKYTEDVDKLREEAMEESDFETYSKSKYNRFKVDLPEEVKVQMAKVGVRAKKLLAHAEVSAYREEKKKGLSLESRTDDIDDLMKFSKFLVDKAEESENETILNLIKESYSIHDFDQSPWLSAIQPFLSSNLGVWSKLVSDIATELSISLKQHCKPREVIVKKLKRFNIYLIIVPSSMAKHLSYCLYMDASEILYHNKSACFKNLITDGSVCWTEFHSFNAEKLNNLVKAHASCLSLYAFCGEMAGESLWEEPLKNTNELIFLLLVLFEDKSRTEEIITMSRYIFMEGFVSQPCLPKPHKMITKLPDVLRTRLQVWLVKRTLKNMQRICSSPFTLTTSEKSVKWLNMFNPWTLKELNDPFHLISAFYYGYLKNKEEHSGANSLSKLYSKIIEYETKKPNSRNFLGLKDTLDPQTHEFSLSWLKFCVDFSKGVMRKQWGSTVEAIITENTLDDIARYDLEKLSTMKASSLYSEKYYEPDSVSNYHRRKVAEAVLTEFPGKSQVYEVLVKCLEDVEDQGCMNIDIFKKPQHGGLREIYVLGIKERVCQLVLETIARNICARFASETMMNPRSKSSLPDSHIKIGIEKGGAESVTICTSDDAKKWNQCHYVAKFAAMLVRMTDKIFHPFILRTCSMFLKKRIMIDPSLIKIMMENDEIQTTDPIFRDLHQAFRGYEKKDWCIGKSYVETETGMMQGILHHTSSLLHTVFQETLKGFVKSKLDKVSGQFFPNRQSHVTVMQSSDDSCMMITCPFDSETSMKAMLTACCISFQIKKELGVQLGIYASEKCTSGTIWLMEFNSEFHFHRSQMRPLMRWVSACLAITEQESLAARQEEMYGNLTNVLSGGGSFFLTSLCQIAQLLLHYQLLGISISPLFKEYSELIMQLPDPAQGFFLLDHPFCSGLLGFKYNLWSALKVTKLGMKYKMFLRSMEEGNVEGKTLETTTSGTFVQSTLIRWGNRKKWEKLVESMNFPENWRELIDQSPEVLYRRAFDSEEFMLRMAAFIHSPGVSTSLSKGNVAVRVISSSVYLLNKSVLMDNSSMLLGNSVKGNKISLLLSTLRSAKAVLGQSSMLSDDDMALLFPYFSDYIAIEEVLEKFKVLKTGIKTRHKARVSSRIEVSESEVDMLFTAEAQCKLRWFGLGNLPASRRVRDRQWLLLRTRIHWIRETAEDTLEQSPFKNHIQLRNFLSRLETNRRVVMISGAPMKKTGGISNLVTAIVENFSPSVELQWVYDDRKRMTSIQSSELQHLVYLNLTGPYTDEEKNYNLLGFLKEYPTTALNEMYGKTRKNMLSLIQEFVKAEDNSKILEKMFDARMGSLGGFVQPQRPKMSPEGTFVGYQGWGIWKGMLDSTTLSLHVKDNTLQAVIVNKTESLKDVLFFVKRLCKEFGLSNTEYTSFKPRFIKNTALFGRCYNFNFRPLRSTEGCLILIDSSDYMFDPSLLSDLRLSFKRLTINITAKYSNMRGRISLISYTARERDLMPQVASSDPLISRLKQEPSKSWFGCTSIHPKLIYKLVDNPDLKIPGVDMIVFRSLLTELFYGELRNQGIYQPIMRTSHFVDDDLSSDEIFDTMLSFDPSVMTMFGETVSAITDPFEYTIEFDPSLGDQFAQVEPADVVGLRFYSHPFLTKVVNQMLKDIGAESLQKIVTEKVYTRNTKEATETISFLLGLTMQDFKQEEEEVEELEEDEDLEWGSAAW